MGSESIANEAEGRMGYWLTGQEGERNNCFSKIQLILIMNSTDYFIDIRFLALLEMKEKYNFEFPFTTYYGLGITCHNKWAWWVSKMRNNFEVFFYKRCLFCHTWQKLLGTHCWRQNLKSWAASVKNLGNNQNWSCSRSKLFTTFYLLNLAFSMYA